MILPDNIGSFQEHLKILQQFVRDEDWYHSLVFDLALNLEFEQWVMLKFQDISKEPSGSALESLLNSMRQDMTSCLENASFSEHPLEKWLSLRSAYARYGLTEVFIESSTFSEGVMSRLKQRLSGDYLKVLSHIDQLYPSSLTQLHAPVRSIQDIESLPLSLLQTAEVTDYLILKKWQDDQNQFHHQVLYPSFLQSRLEFEAWFKEQYPFLSEHNGRSLTALGLIAKQELVPVEVLTRMLLGGVGREITALVGGKAYGLARLQSIGRPIPQTWIIPVPAIATSSYIHAISDLPPARWAVRSSATVEDNEKTSFAGLFLTKLNVVAEELTNTINEVAESVHTPRVQAYSEHFCTESPMMAVVLQPFREPQYAGVWIGQHHSTGILEWVEGSGDDLVSGRVRPHREYWSDDGEPPQNEVYHKPRLADHNHTYVGAHCLGAQQKIGDVLDLEWCLLDGKLVWLQCRPVTSIIIMPDLEGNHSAQANYFNQTSILRGIPASEGTVQAKAVVAKDLKSISDWHTGAILITVNTDPEWVPLMMKASGIITSEGGILSHAAIIARELGLPCVTSVVNAVEKIKTGQEIRINGRLGTVEIIDK